MENPQAGIAALSPLPIGRQACQGEAKED